MKQCNRCHQTKSLEEFHTVPNFTRQGGRRPMAWCMACNNIRQTKYRKSLTIEKSLIVS